MPLTELAKTFATSEHRIYKARAERWAHEEKMLRGGPAVRELILPFQWEASDEDHLKNRKATASYLNFAERMVGRFVGHIDAERPTPDSGINFGALGAVRGEDAITGAWSKAEHLWYDCDGQGTPFALFMSEAHKRAVATGHRWIVAEMTAEAPQSAADEAAGLRPYLVEHSPRDVPNWRVVDGQLVALVTRTAVEALVNAEGEYAEEPLTRYTLYVAAGPHAARFAPEAAASGLWAILDENGDLIAEADGQPTTGTLEATGGEIPAFTLLYRGDDEELSVSGTEDLNAVARSYMSISSAGDSDVHQTAARFVMLFGLGEEQFNQGAEVKAQGGRLVPFPPSYTPTGQTSVSYYDSASVSGGETVDRALERKRREAAEIAADELRSAPTASGEARKVEFVDAKAPRLTLMAYHRERAENEALRYLALRWGEAPDAFVAWPKRFDVADTVEDWLAVFNAASRMQAESPTLVVAGLKRILKAKNVALDAPTWSAIEAEVRAAADARTQAADDLSTVGDPFADTPSTQDPDA